VPDIKHSPGRVRLILDGPHGNAITDAMVGSLRGALRSIAPPVKLVTIEGAGRDFSFGASIGEHAPERMADVLPRFHAFIVELLRVPAVTVAAVAGRCLGGGFEIALACDVIIASEDAVLGLPELGVGAFPPVGSILLPLKAGAARAAAAILDGTARSAAEWHAAGIVHRLAPQNRLSDAIDDWYTSTIDRYSAAVLQRAAMATRLVVLRSVDALLPQSERLYLNDLLSTVDAAEGIAAFLEKRPPRWKDA
jgi:cyclohexa-1,5-dienecarbonyl-CoA hydratase